MENKYMHEISVFNNNNNNNTLHLYSALYIRFKALL